MSEDRCSESKKVKSFRMCSTNFDSKNPEKKFNSERLEVKLLKLRAFREILFCGKYSSYAVS